jgi:hypothetical protein
MEDQAPVATTPQEEQVSLDAKNENESVVPVVEAQALPTITLHLIPADQADNKQEQKPAPKKAAKPRFEKQEAPWKGWVLSDDPITTILAYCKELKERPKGLKGCRIAAKNITFGINKSIENAGIHSKSLEVPSSAMQEVLYNTKPHYTEQLGTMISTCNTFKLHVKDQDLLKAYKYLKDEDKKDLESLQRVFNVAQAGLQERKKIRDTIWKMASSADNLECPSDDEKYSNKGLSDLMLTYTTPASTDK